MSEIELELPKVLMDRLREVAKKRGITVAQLLREIIEKNLDEIEKKTQQH